MNILDIVKEYLIENGYDGLFYSSECGCSVDDLMPCGEPSPNCDPGYKVECSEGSEFDFIITDNPNIKDCSEV